MGTNNTGGSSRSNNSHTREIEESSCQPFIRVIVQVSEDLKELRGIYPPGNSEEEDLKIEALLREKFGIGSLGSEKRGGV